VKTRPGIRRAVDWGELAPLRLRARQVAEGIYAGLHRSVLRGAGVEFGGYREYVAGDDLRWLDRRSLLRHERLVVRQFETETDRALCLLVDASASMGFRGPRAPAAKFAFAAVLAAALARVALANGDPVSLTFLAGENGAPIGRSSGREQFERILDAFESMRPWGEVGVEPAALDRTLQSLARGSRKGAIVAVFSDLLDWPAGAADRLAQLASSGRLLTVVQTLDPAEVDFPFEGTVRLRALEGDWVVETDAETTRDQYLTALAALTGQWRDVVTRRGGRFLTTTTTNAPIAVVRDIVKAIK
jgi:uncharacterized protein (DUF58 family)